MRKILTCISLLSVGLISLTSAQDAQDYPYWYRDILDELERGKTSFVPNPQPGVRNRKRPIAPSVLPVPLSDPDYGEISEDARRSLPFNNPVKTKKE